MRLRSARTSCASLLPCNSMPARSLLRSTRASCGAQLVAPVRIERAETLHALANRRMRDEQCREAFLGEGIDRVQRLGRRAGCELEQLLGLLEPDQSEIGRASCRERV